MAMREPMNGQPTPGKEHPQLLRRFGLLQATALIMLVMFRAVACNRPKRRNNWGCSFPGVGWPFMGSRMAIATLQTESKLIDFLGRREQKHNASVAKQKKIS